MDINYIDLKDIVKQQSDCEMLLETFSKELKGSVDSAKRLDIICSVFKQRRYLKLKNKELVKFINKFSPRVYCVYKLYLDENLVYVGSSYAIITRIATHFKDKLFNSVDICTKGTKQEMLALEHKLIDLHKPKYNKSSNLKYLKLYGEGVAVEDEHFISLESFLIEQPVRKNASNILYTLFNGSSFKYPYGKLNSNGKHGITAYFIQEDNTPFSWYSPTNKVVTNKHDLGTDNGKRLSELLMDKDLMQYVTKDCPQFEVDTFDNTYIFTNKKWRNIGNPKWYTVSNPQYVLRIFEEHIESKYGSYSLKEDPIFPFGKYRNRKVSDIVKEDSKYIEWCINSMEDKTLLQLGLISKDSIKPIFETALERLGRL